MVRSNIYKSILQEILKRKFLGDKKFCEKLRFHQGGRHLLCVFEINIYVQANRKNSVFREIEGEAKLKLLQEIVVT